ncbi:MAG: hypothetical protein KJO07_12085 [Deltaproteobacteria bacterium]|nr:hypothetical protein [Deltaproteobacteria bacterium]
MVGMLGCPKPDNKVSKGEQVRIRAFTDARPVRDLAVLGSSVFVSSGDRLLRFGLAGGNEPQLFDEDSGLEPGDIYDLAPDTGAAAVWIATSRGVTRFTSADQSFSDLPDPPRALRAGMSTAVIEPTGDGSVYLGGDFGLYRYSGRRWESAGVADPVIAMARGPDSTLWVGTGRGLFRLDTTGATPVGPAQGVDIVKVTSVVLGPGNTPLVLGLNQDGQQRLAARTRKGFATYRVSPKMQWMELAADGRRAVALGADRRLYELAVKKNTRAIGRDRIELLPASPKGAPLAPPSPLSVRRMNVRVPGLVTTLVMTSDGPAVGTKDLGTGVAVGKGRWRWLRRADLTDKARFLTVACAARDDCYLANASSAASRFDGKSFRDPGLKGRGVEAFVRRPTGEIYALVRHGDESIGVSALTGSRWTDFPTKVTLPEGRVELSFARFSPGGLMWLGVGYVDADGDIRPKGVALVDVTTGSVSYHHASSDADAERRGVLPVPINTVDVSFLGMAEVWLASSQGAVRVRGTEVKLYNETDGLRSEYLSGIACSASGMVYVAARQGIGAYDGERWSYPSGLATPANDIRFADDGRLWLGTDRGLVSFDGAKIRRLDARRGLLEDKVVDLDIDHFGRLWIRGSESITVVIP